MHTDSEDSNDDEVGRHNNFNNNMDSDFNPPPSRARTPSNLPSPTALKRTRDDETEDRSTPMFEDLLSQLTGLTLKNSSSNDMEDGGFDDFDNMDDRVGINGTTNRTETLLAAETRLYDAKLSALMEVLAIDLETSKVYMELAEGDISRALNLIIDAMAPVEAAHYASSDATNAKKRAKKMDAYSEEQLDPDGIDISTLCSIDDGAFFESSGPNDAAAATSGVGDGVTHSKFFLGDLAINGNHFELHDDALLSTPERLPIISAPPPTPDDVDDDISEDNSDVSRCPRDGDEEPTWNSSLGH
jgi:hypothetical protein